jgi:hypothetical protein
LADFCHELALPRAAELAARRVTLYSDIPNHLVFDMPRELVRRVLDEWIDDALRALPDGGELDLTVVVGPSGLEIELADSRSLDLSQPHQRWQKRELLADGAPAEAGRDAVLEVRTMNCPQGGLARTLRVAQANAAWGLPPTAQRKAA